MGRSSDAGMLFVFGMLLAAVVFLGPLALIWALNTLFPSLAIPYTFWTWLAAMILGGAVCGSSSTKKD